MSSVYYKTGVIDKSRILYYNNYAITLIIKYGSRKAYRHNQEKVISKD